LVQAEDGIRDGHVTGVQTCALPILHRWLVRYEAGGLEGLGDGSQCRSQSSLTTHQPEADTSTICMSGDAPARQDAPFGVDRYMEIGRASCRERAEKVEGVGTAAAAL